MNTNATARTASSTPVMAVYAEIDADPFTFPQTRVQIRRNSEGLNWLVEMIEVPTQLASNLGQYVVIDSTVVRNRAAAATLAAELVGA